MELGIRGRKRRLILEGEHWALILAEVGTVETCRMVGIGRKTGYRRRTELDGLGPARRAEAQQSERYLSLMERERIAVLRRQGLSMRAIATRLSRAPSTLSRELRRNTVRLHTGRSMRRRRRRPDQRTPRFIALGLLIDQCPAVVEEPVRSGD